MSESSIFGSVEIVKVHCSRCLRIVRALAYAGVMGEADLERIGWSADGQGKPVCDEHGGMAPLTVSIDEGWIACPAGCGVQVEECECCVHCAVCPACCHCGNFTPRSDATASAEAYDLETVARFEALVNQLFAAGLIDHDEQVSGRLSCEIVRWILTRRSQGGR
jgi:hypothetical protein